jgi:hypothetical protein
MIKKCIYCGLIASAAIVISSLERLIPLNAIIPLPGVKLGLANAVVHRLAELDPKRYEESAKRMEIKAQRAAQRKAEQLAHEKNVRMGKRKPKAQTAEQETAPEKKTSDKKASGKKTSAPVRKAASAKPERKRSGEAPKSRPSKENRPKPRAKTNRFAGSRPVKKGKGSFRKKDD